VSICAWFDNDSFGEIVSPTMNATTLATVMRTIRPDLEIGSRTNGACAEISAEIQP
jgi:hypothetical protein